MHFSLFPIKITLLTSLSKISKYSILQIKDKMKLTANNVTKNELGNKKFLLNYK